MIEIIVWLTPNYTQYETIWVDPNMTREELINVLNKKFNVWYYYDYKTNE